jgi:tRNA(Ile2) C34 agmatinyltransferase TiaS
MVLQARCPECGRRAEVNDEMSEVRCKFCGFSTSYDDYIEIMKGKATDIASNFQENFDKSPF